MANYSKNIVVGCGGKSMIDSSHMLGAAYGIEKILGTIENPVRALFDHVQQEFLAGLPILYFLTVSAGTGSEHKTVGAFAGSSRKVFEAAALLSRQVNIIEIPERVKKAIVFLDHKRFKSTWLGNKAIYRTRMMLADDAELLVLAPGVKLFGEDRENDVLIRKYGYAGRQQVFTWLKTQADLRNNLSVAAHLIHGSSEGRFKITYAVDHLTRQEIEKVGFSHAELSRIRHLYPVDQWQDGFRTLSDGTEAYFISNPATALWVASRQTSEAERVDV